MNIKKLIASTWKTFIIIIIVVFFVLLFTYLIFGQVDQQQSGEGDGPIVEDRWYPEVIEVDGTEYVPREDFDYVYSIVEDIEYAELEVKQLPSIEIVTTRSGQVYARHVPDDRTLRVKIDYIDKSVELTGDWLEGRVRVVNDEAIEPDRPITWTFGARGSFIGAFDVENDGLFKPLYDFSAFVESPQLWLFNGFFSFGYRPMEPYLMLGINFKYEYEQ